MAEEVRLWLWRYTDDFGKRRETRYRLSEENARASLRDPERVEGSLHWVDERLSSVLADVRAGRFKETTWHLFRLTYFPALGDEEVAELLGKWSRRHGIEVRLRPADLWVGKQRSAAIFLNLVPGT